MVMEGPWNPGLRSPLPRELAHLSTLYRSDNTFTGVTEAREFSELIGLPVEELVVFKPERLLVHELLVRITADISIPDGTKQADLGVGFRGIANTILEHYVAAEFERIKSEYDALRVLVSTTVRQILTQGLDKATSTRTLNDVPASPWRRLSQRLGFMRGQPETVAGSTPTPQDAVLSWQQQLQDIQGQDMERVALESTIRVINAVLIRHGRLWGERALHAEVATGLAMNELGSRCIGRMLTPLIDAAIDGEGYRRLPEQRAPVVMNTKGPSASGKSSLRPRQRQRAEALGLEWSEFALISPDIWRKFLLDYHALEEHYKYAGLCTSREVEIIDKKLDRYMAAKAKAGRMTHLLIDRFRFDSFAADSEEAGSNLLTRFGDLIYLYFMITPPGEIVERAWRRGLEVGRYKTVDDLLHHNVEAYTGMPVLFFTWALRTDKRVHYEFLDNDVPKNNVPRTVAFGWNGEMNIIYPGRLLDVERFRRVDINAGSPAALYPDARVLESKTNLQFIHACVKCLPIVNFVVPETGVIYAQSRDGRTQILDAAATADACTDLDTQAVLESLNPVLVLGARTLDMSVDTSNTLGWINWI